jgi:hypothetical protein
VLRLIDLKQEEFGFFLVILQEKELTVDEPWVSEDVDAVEAAELKMEKRLPLEGGLRPLVKCGALELRPLELEQEPEILVIWVSRLGWEVDLCFAWESILVESEG